MKTIALMCMSIFGIAANAPAARPNIILVMPDDAGYGDYSGLGNPIISTPVVDALASHPEVVALLRSEYDRWWAETQPMMVNASAAKPDGQPFRELDVKQFGRIPDKVAKTKKRPGQREAEGLTERQRLRKLRAERRQRSKTGTSDDKSQDTDPHANADTRTEYCPG